MLCDVVWCDRFEEIRQQVAEKEKELDYLSKLRDRPWLVKGRFFTALYGEGESSDQVCSSLALPMHFPCPVSPANDVMSFHAIWVDLVSLDWIAYRRKMGGMGLTAGAFARTQQ